MHKAKKSLGQNFLKSVLALNKIVEAGEIKDTDTILEIGPGKGALTEKLLEKAGKVIAVEKDQDLLEILQEKFKSQIENGKFILLNKDILDFDAKAYGLEPSAYKIIANIPYNITGAIFKKFLTEENQPELMVLMVQHEVAKRIVANDKKESILSISVKAYGEPKMIMKVPARYFSPAPSVDSAVIAVKNINREKFTSPQPSPYKGEGANTVNEEKFWEIIHAGFAHKRKVLASNLKKFDKRIDWVSILEERKINKNTRAEDLQLSDWIYITSRI